MKTVIVALVIGILSGVGSYFGLEHVLHPKGSDFVSVPQLDGLTEAQASQILHAKDLRLAVYQHIPSVVAKGKVVFQVPKKNSSLAKHHFVYVSLSNGQGAIQKKEKAKDASNSVAIDKKEDTNTAKEDKKDSPSKDVVAKEDDAKKIIVPRLIGKTLEVAKSMIRSAGLTIERIHYIVDEDKAPNRVLRQSLAPKKLVAKGSAIRIYVNRSDL